MDRPSLFRFLLRNLARLAPVWLEQRTRRWRRLRKYRRQPQGTVFDICVDETRFRMSFQDLPIGLSTVERIEGIREPETVAAIRAIVRRGSNVLELGACWGYFTAIMADCVGQSGHVLAVEGSPRHCEILRANLELNGLSNVSVSETFILNDADKVEFAEGEVGPYGVMDRMRTGRSITEGERTTVRAVRLTSLLKERQFIPDHIFMDIEGFEIEVCKDFKNTNYLQFHRPTILFETHPQFYSPGRDLDFILQVFREYDYDCRRSATNVICLPCVR